MLRITTLIENSPGEHHGLATEHGISFCVEKDGHMILFDTGQSGAFLSTLRNEHQPGEWTRVLSHGHFDHSGDSAPSAPPPGASPSSPVKGSFPPSTLSGTAHTITSEAISTKPFFQKREFIM